MTEQNKKFKDIWLIVDSQSNRIKGTPWFEYPIQCENYCHKHGMKYANWRRFRK